LIIAVLGPSFIQCLIFDQFQRRIKIGELKRSKNCRSKNKPKYLMTAAPKRLLSESCWPTARLKMLRSCVHRTSRKSTVQHATRLKY
jgi:hypothetical protein